MQLRFGSSLAGCLLFAFFPVSAQSQELVPEKAAGALRVATYNVSLNRPEEGGLTRDLLQADEQAWAVASVIRAVQPDVLLINELDYSAAENNAMLFRERYLDAEREDLLGGKPWSMPHVFSSEVNTGVPSGLDLNRNGSVTDPEDAWGYGRFPGQYGMAVYSRFPLDEQQIRSFRLFAWAELPGALKPQAEGEPPYYEEAVWQRLRLSSKSFWDVPIQTPKGVVHVLASHPTPPGFDGAEDRNGCRNHDEIRLVQYYIEGSTAIRDDQQLGSGMSDQDSFVILGDLNCDPVDGNSFHQAIRDLISHRRVAQFDPPVSTGAVQAAKEQGQANRSHQGDAAQDTGDFSDRSVGNLRVDYALPSANFEVLATGVFWPALDDVASQQREAVRQCMAASDHHLVWIDIR
ncbi:MAG: endonuclease/exonuclease/phosphatase family protein [bacterium]|nr:endonuclease/exonuclease/phosphatase family protein [bacterium]